MFNLKNIFKRKNKDLAPMGTKMPKSISTKEVKKIWAKSRKETEELIARMEKTIDREVKSSLKSDCQPFCVDVDISASVGTVPTAIQRMNRGLLTTISSRGLAPLQRKDFLDKTPRYSSRVSCHACGKEFDKTEELHYTIEKNPTYEQASKEGMKSTSLYFHPQCFEDIAGDLYL